MNKTLLCKSGYQLGKEQCCLEKNSLGTPLSRGEENQSSLCNSLIC